jgi:hypothetical protein
VAALAAFFIVWSADRGIQIGTNLNSKLWDDQHLIAGPCGVGGALTEKFLDGSGNCFVQLPVPGSQFSAGPWCYGIRIGKNLSCKLWDG